MESYIVQEIKSTLARLNDPHLAHSLKYLFQLIESEIRGNVDYLLKENEKLTERIEKLEAGKS